MNISEFSTVVFDCDGVILDSNKVKTDAFYRTALPYGKAQAEEFVRYHKDTGGVSRYVKFRWFISRFGLEGETSLDELLLEYSSFVKSGLNNCEVAEDLVSLRNLNPLQKWMIVSGGDQEELRLLFKERNLYDMFDAGIYGSPDSKSTIISREISDNNLTDPAIFIGDSRLDYLSANKFNLAFCFLSNWTEVPEWREFCKENGVFHLPSISSLLTNKVKV